MGQNTMLPKAVSKIKYNRPDWTVMIEKILRQMSMTPFIT